MEIDDFLKADCNLFLVPPVDVTTVATLIDRAVLQAWQQGSSAQKTLEALSTNSEILGTVTAQVEKNLEFQKQTALQNLEAKAQQAIGQYQEESKLKAAQVEATTGVEAKLQAAEFQAKEQSWQQEHQSYSIAQRRLEEARSRIRKRLGEVGGTVGYQKLVDIEQKLKEPVTVSSEVKSTGAAELPSSTPQEATIPTGLQLVMAEKKIDPLTQALEEAANAATAKDKISGTTIQPSARKETGGRIYQLFHKTPLLQKVYSVLTYKIW